MKEKKMKLLGNWCIAVATLFVGCIQMPKTTEQDSSLPRTMVDGYGFHTIELGDKDKPPMILIHGGPGGDSTYLMNLQALSADYHILLYDQRNTGLSPREKEINDTLSSSITDLNRLVEIHAQGKPVILIGHSWGAMISVGYITRYPQKVKAAVLMEPGMLDTEAAKYFVKIMKESNSFFTILKMIPLFLKIPFVKSIDGEEKYDYVMTYMLNHGGGKPYQCEGTKLPDNSFKRAGYSVFNKMLKPVLDDPERFTDEYTKGVENFSGKILLLSSECSFIGYDFQEKFHIKKFSATTKHWEMKNTGHSMPTTDPDKTVQYIKKFLNGEKLNSPPDDFKKEKMK